MSKSSQANFVARVEGIDGTWGSQSGGNSTAETSMVYDGGALVPDVVSGRPQVEDITVSRVFDAARDDDLLRTLRPLVGSWTTTVSKTPTDANMIAIAQPTVYPNAVLKGIGEPEVDANSSDPANLSLTFACPQVR